MTSAKFSMNADAFLGQLGHGRLGELQAKGLDGLGGRQAAQIAPHLEQHGIQPRPGEPEGRRDSHDASADHHSIGGGRPVLRRRRQDVPHGAPP